MAALTASRPDVSGKSARDIELEEANAEIDRLGEVVKELAVKPGRQTRSVSREPASGWCPRRD